MLDELKDAALNAVINPWEFMRFCEEAIPVARKDFLTLLKAEPPVPPEAVHEARQLISFDNAFKMECRITLYRALAEKFGHEIRLSDLKSVPDLAVGEYEIAEVRNAVSFIVYHTVRHVYATRPEVREALDGHSLVKATADLTVTLLPID